MYRTLLLLAALLFCLHASARQLLSKADTALPADDKLFEKVEVESSFPGGHEAWRAYLVKNLKPNTSVKKNTGRHLHHYRAFYCGQRWHVSEVLAETNHGYGMEGEVIRIIKKSPRWNPAMQHGPALNAYRRQPDTFVVRGM